MLNSNNERELAYLVRIDNITPIEGYDRVELAHIGGWTVVVGKDDLCVGDLAIYFEIDSQVPNEPPFSDMEFLVNKKFKIKTQKMCKSISQGLICPISAFENFKQLDEDSIIDIRTKKTYNLNDDSRFLTKALNVVYATAEDRIRKSNSKKQDKYQKMLNKHPELAKNKLTRFLYKYSLGKKILFFIYGKDVKDYDWPDWVVKTDEERVQNIPYIIKDKNSWIATEKIDGTSTTFTLKKNPKNNKREYFVCSRNVCFGDTDLKKSNKDCYYNSNVYSEMSIKYNIKKFLNDYMDEYSVDWVTLQGETYGEGIQKRTYSKKDHCFAAFNLIDSNRYRLNPIEGREKATKGNIPWVPIVNDNFILPDSVEELLDQATGKSEIDGLPREGLVFRNTTDDRSFKAVSNEYLLKYH